LEISSTVIRAHISALIRPGTLPITLLAAWATASGAIADVHEPPLGRSTAASSAALVLTTLVVLASSSWAITLIGTVCGSTPRRPATALNPSLVTVPRSCPEAASL
jgi:hypothetical protein